MGIVVVAREDELEDELVDSSTASCSESDELDSSAVSSSTVSTGMRFLLLFLVGSFLITLDIVQKERRSSKEAVYKSCHTKPMNFSI